MKRLFVILLSYSLVIQATGQANTLAVKFSNAMMTRYTPTINAMTSKGWEYSNTIILHGMEKVYNNVNDAAYLNYIKAFIDSYLNADGTFKAGVTLVSLDRIHPGISCLFLYEKLKSNSADSLKYRRASTSIRNVLVGASASYAPYRTPNRKIFWHKQSSYDNIMMLDGMYMAHPFLAKYGKIFGDNAAIDTAVNQTLFAYNQLYVSGTHLVKHAWKEPGSSGSVSWDDAAGNSTSVWSRALGWYSMALVDILKYVPTSHPRRGELLTALSNIAIGLKTYQDATSYLWYHVVDKNASSLSGNYLETSGSAMFVYTLKTAIDSGWISSATYLPVVQSGWTGLQTKISTYTDSKPQINDFSPAMSVQNTEALYVQASLQPVDCPTSSGTQHPHGYAAILMAASVMEFPMTTLPVKFISVNARAFPSSTSVSWHIGEESNIVHYEVQRSTNGTDFAVIDRVLASGRTLYVSQDLSGNKTVYYRINAISQDGSSHLSAIVAVRKNGRLVQIKVSPNPVQGGHVNLAFENVNKGTYQYRLINNTGSILKSGSIQLEDDNSSSKAIPLPSGLLNGLYFVQLEGNGIKLNAGFTIK